MLMVKITATGKCWILVIGLFADVNKISFLKYIRVLHYEGVDLNMGASNSA